VALLRYGLHSALRAHVVAGAKERFNSREYPSDLLPLPFVSSVRRPRVGEGAGAGGCAGAGAGAGAALGAGAASVPARVAASAVAAALLPAVPPAVPAAALCFMPPSARLGWTRRR